MNGSDDRVSERGGRGGQRGGVARAFGSLGEEGGELVADGRPQLPRRHAPQLLHRRHARRREGRLGPVAHPPERADGQRRDEGPGAGGREGRLRVRLVETRHKLREQLVVRDPRRAPAAGATGR